MSDIDVAFFYDTLENFKSSGYKIVKSPQIIPYFYVKNTNNIFAMLTLNRSGHVGDFSIEYSRTKSLESNIADSIRFNSLGTIGVDEDFVLRNSFIGFATAYNVIEGKNTLSSTEIPSIFVRFEVESVTDIQNILLKFKAMFAQKLKGVIRNTSDVTNIVYMSVEDLFYISRFTTYKIVDDVSKRVVTVDMEEQGFPALDEVTEIYYADRELGDIPCTDKFNELENCCPEVEFYNNRSLLLGKSLISLFSNDLPIMME